MDETQRTTNAQHQAAHRRGVATQLREIRAAVEALNDALAVLIAERQPPEHQEHTECQN